MSPRLFLVLCVSAVAGAATMVVELAAVRLLAPWFGTSQLVWTNVIGVVLLALALGYAVGGRLSQRHAPLPWLAAVLALAAATGAALPSLAPWVTGLFLPAELALQEAARVLTWSSLASACLLFLPPAALLGMVAPLSVQAVQELSGYPAGRSGGLVLSTSTLGSLAGVFGTSHTLLPHLGTGGTYLAAAVALAAGALCALALARGGPGRGRSSPTALLALVALGLSSLGPLGWRALHPGPPALRAGERLLGQRETPYQSARVVENETYDPPLRFLQVNEGFDSFQSVWQDEPGLLPEGFYYDAFALPAFWAEARGTWRLLVLGLGAGTTFRVLEGASPEGLRWERVGVELDPGVVALAREHMGLDATRPDTLVLSGIDARAALRALEGRFDYVVLDAFANQVEIPPHLATLEFFGELRRRLAPGGWLAVNVGGFAFEDPVVAAVGRTVARAFDDRALVLRVPSSRNFVVFARADAPLPIEDDGRLRAVAPPLASWLAPLELPDGWRRVDGDGPGLLLRDDDAPTEWLQERSLFEARRLLVAGEATR